MNPLIYEAATVEGEPSEPYLIVRHGTKHGAAVSFAYRNPGGLVFATLHEFWPRRQPRHTPRRRPSKGLLTDAWVRAAHPRAAAAPTVGPAEEHRR